MNERQRAALRARLMVLDSDDQTAAMLAMRDSIRKLESQVRELQLKLSGMSRPRCAAPATSEPPGRRRPKPAPPSPNRPEPRRRSPRSPSPTPGARKRPSPPRPGRATVRAARRRNRRAAAAEDASRVGASRRRANAARTPARPRPDATPRPSNAQPVVRVGMDAPGAARRRSRCCSALWLLARRRAASAARGRGVLRAARGRGAHRDRRRVRAGASTGRAAAARGDVGSQPDVSAPAPLLATDAHPARGQRRAAPALRRGALPRDRATARSCSPIPPPS